MLEPDVTLTDFALAIECGAFAFWLGRPRRSSAPTGPAFVALFVASALAALLGGISHGFLPDETTLPAKAAWTGTLVAIGVAAFACWVIGARLVLSDSGARRIAMLAGVLFIGYLAVILFVSRSFTIAVAGYAPAMAFLMIAFGLAYRRRPAAFLLAGLAGVTLSFVAAAVQQTRIDLVPVYFNYNALYHVIQALAFFLLFLAARGLTNRAAG